jgi:hypothetical protein
MQGENSQREGTHGNRSNRAVKWTIAFDHEGLSADDIRILSALVRADVCLMQFGHLDSDDNEAAAERIRATLSTKFPGVRFRIVRVPPS